MNGSFLKISGFSFPSPDESHYKIPEVGTGQRSQYYVLHSDGTYKYGFDGGDGAFESVKSHVVGSRDGKFGYVDPEGNAIRLEYKAGEEGFVPQGAHIPTPSPEFTKAFEEASNRIPTSFSHTSDSEVWDSNTDASYGFEFSSDDHSRNEKSDADGTVTGTYSYVDENGRKRNFNYRAGKGIGFVIDGDGLEQDVSGIAQSYSGPARQPSISGESFSSHVTSTKSQTPGDASYSFSYDAGDHSRSETSDPNLNINGRFSFVADDGKERRVNYVAGASTGFQAEGDHFPKVSDVHSTRPQTISSVARQPSRLPLGTVTFIS
ncbi:Endocuticle structural glycoprotein SgAbd-3 [Armadillidium vulgare]|nr:Endocuticle structural glycoprotein SgAbd-3 [Armadillidium vulgare]